MNIASADGTVVFSHGELSGGSLLTKQVADMLERPALWLNLETESPEDAAARLASWIARYHIRVLNVAGPSHREAPEIYAGALAVLSKALAPE